MNKENVNHPEHYNKGKIEAIDAMESAFGAAELTVFCRISAFKYLWRSSEKGNEIEDLQKAAWYINKAIVLLAKKTKKVKPSVIARLSKSLSALGKKIGSKKAPARKAMKTEEAPKAKRAPRKPKSSVEAKAVRKPSSPPAVPGTEKPVRTRAKRTPKAKAETEVK